jgi:hypothetical protein
VGLCGVEVKWLLHKNTFLISGSNTFAKIGNKINTHFTALLQASKSKKVQIVYYKLGKRSSQNEQYN